MRELIVGDTYREGGNKFGGSIGMAEEIIPGVEKDDLEIPAAEEDNEPKEETSIPVHVLTKLRGELQKSKTEKKDLAQQLDLYKANMPQSQQVVAQPTQNQEESNIFGDLDEDDVVTVKHMKEVLMKQDAYYQGKVSELQLGTQDKDYSQVIKDYLPKAIEADPGLRDIIKGSNNPLATAYRFAQYEKKAAAPTNTKNNKAGEVDANDPISVIDKILDGAQKPTSPSAVGGSSGGLDGSVVYINMSNVDVDKAFEKLGVQI